VVFFHKNTRILCTKSAETCGRFGGFIPWKHIDHLAPKNVEIKDKGFGRKGEM